jgi:solute carrier family 25 carnitine/acylcarnitine transporter 20/29
MSDSSLGEFTFHLSLQQTTDIRGTKPSPAVDFVSGVIAGESARPASVSSDWIGAAGLIVGQPFDVVKVRYQTPEYAGRYTSTFKALGRIYRLST